LKTTSCVNSAGIVVGPSFVQAFVIIKLKLK